MKTKCTLLIMLLLIVASGALAESLWPLLLVDEPFHVGDNVIKTMKHPHPQGRVLQQNFDLPNAVLPSYLYVTLWISDMIPKNHSGPKKGLYRNTLQINGKEVCVLNKRVDPPEGPEVQKVSIQIKKSILTSGENKLSVIAGAQGANLDDFEVHKIVISKKLQ